MVLRILFICAAVKPCHRPDRNRFSLDADGVRTISGDLHGCLLLRDRPEQATKSRHGVRD